MNKYVLKIPMTDKQKRDFFKMYKSSGDTTMSSFVNSIIKEHKIRNENKK